MDVADEYHYLFKCEYFKSKREECLDTMYYIHPNTHKYNILFNSSNKRELLKLKHFIDVSLLFLFVLPFNDDQS